LVSFVYSRLALQGVKFCLVSGDFFEDVAFLAKKNDLCRFSDFLSMKEVVEVFCVNQNNKQANYLCIHCIVLCKMILIASLSLLLFVALRFRLTAVVSYLPNTAMIEKFRLETARFGLEINCSRISAFVI
jgi:hypothetical protein